MSTPLPEKLENNNNTRNYETIETFFQSLKHMKESDSTVLPDKKIITSEELRIKLGIRDCFKSRNPEEKDVLYIRRFYHSTCIVYYLVADWFDKLSTPDKEFHCGLLFRSS